MKNELREWEISYLTNIGKIAVLKLKIILKPNHVFFNSLPSPNTTVTHAQNDICNKFICIKNQLK